jgi:hypothetical protein
MMVANFGTVATPASYTAATARPIHAITVLAPHLDVLHTVQET